jgi:DNA-binding response OmpR family regulator
VTTAPTHLLIADDDALGAETLTALMRTMGYEADWAASGEAALAKMGTRHYDAVVIDEYMVGLDGMEVLRRMRALTQYRAVPVLILTAAAERHVTEMLSEMEGLQPASVLTKPADLAEIVLRLEALAGGPRS